MYSRRPESYAERRRGPHARSLREKCVKYERPRIACVCMLTWYQPLVEILDAQNRPSPALQKLRDNLQKPVFKPTLSGDDPKNASPIRTPHAKIPVLQPAFSEQPLRDTEIPKSPLRLSVDEEDADDDEADRISVAPAEPDVVSLPEPSSQDTVEDTQEDFPIFTQETFQSTQPTQPAQSFRRSIQAYEEEHGEIAESFVSAKEGFANRNTPQKTLDVHEVEIEEISHTTKIATKPEMTVRQPPQPAEPKRHPEQYSIGAETYEALETAHRRAQAAEPKRFVGLANASHESVETSENEGTVVHHDEAENEMDADEEEARSPSDDSSPVKPLMRKSSFTFASLPAREPYLPKKSMGDRVSRTSFLDQSKSRSSQYGRFTGGKSLGGSQYTRITEGQGDEDDDERPALSREESETTKMHNAASTKSLKERLNMLNQRTEPPKRISQSLVVQPPTATNTQQSQPTQPSQSSQFMAPSQPMYPTLPADEAEMDDDDEDSWISPIRNSGPAPYPVRPLPPPVQAADSRPSSSEDMVPQPTLVEDHEMPSVESTTPPGSPELKKYTDGPLSASKAKFYSALRIAKEKIIGSSAASAQVKMDALAASPVRASPLRARIQQTPDDAFAPSPKRTENPSGSIFSHSRSPSKNSVKTLASHHALSALTHSSSISNSPAKEDNRKTRSSSERERVKDHETREKEEKQKQRAEERLREIREREQAKAAAQAAHYQKAKTAKTPAPASAPSTIRPGTASTFKTPVASQSAQSRPGTLKMSTAARPMDIDSADEMPPPPPPKSLLPTGTAQKMRDPRKTAKPTTTKGTLPKGNPQKIQVNLHRDRFGQAPAGAKPAPTTSAPKLASSTIGRQTQVGAKIAPLPSAKASSSRLTTTAPKPAPRMTRPQQLKAAEKPKPAPAPAPRADLGGARPLSRMQTVQDAAQIRVPLPPVNPAKPPAKRLFQVDSEESLHRPAKRPSQQARLLKPMTPAHAQFASGKIPFAEPSQPALQTPQIPNGEDIKLPDIMTDSEDEDSENEFEQPSWVATPNLRSMLEQQQLVDPEQIFGPIAPLNMEQVFPNKERHKRFRERTSSAYWTNDQVTEEERRKEREARERLVREGAWTYNPSPRPTQPYR